MPEDEKRSLKDIWSIQRDFETWYRDRPALVKRRKRKPRKKKAGVRK